VRTAEAAAAYAAGAIDFESAIAVSYYAGFLAQGYQERLNIRGAMVAVGLGPAEALPYLDQLRSGRASVACINSPSSVTISGDVEAVAEVEERLTTEKIFVRRLKVSAAYHSHHMLPQADDYLALLSAKFGLTPGNFANVRYSSPVSGKTVWSAATLGP
jgi:acyl transferase domain-containing protein